jgi:hypothetical protein
MIKSKLLASMVVRLSEFKGVRGGQHFILATPEFHRLGIIRHRDSFNTMQRLKRRRPDGKNCIRKGLHLKDKPEYLYLPDDAIVIHSD